MTSHVRDTRADTRNTTLCDYFSFCPRITINCSFSDGSFIPYSVGILCTFHFEPCFDYSKLSISLSSFKLRDDKPDFISAVLDLRILKMDKGLTLHH